MKVSQKSFLLSGRIRALMSVLRTYRGLEGRVPESKKDFLHRMTVKKEEELERLLEEAEDAVR